MMEETESFIELMRKKRIRHLDHIKKSELQRQNEYNKGLNKIQNLRGERIEISRNITRNLKTLATHKHNVHKILQDVKNTTGLPISTNYQKPAINTFTQIIEFINNIDHILESCKEGNNINTLKLSQDLISCIDLVGNKAHLVKTRYMIKDAFERNMEFLQEQNLDSCEENADTSVFDI